MAVVNIEELSIYCRWVERQPVEQFMDTQPLKKADVLSINSQLPDWLKKKDLHCNKLVKIALESSDALSNEDFENLG